MDFKAVLSTLGGLIFFLGYLRYIAGILKGTVMPAKATWVIWASINVITVMGMLSKGAINGQIIGATIGASIVAILSFKYGFEGWTVVDKICLGGALVSILAWLLSRDALASILICQVVNVFGAIPTFVSIWYRPERENKLTWWIFGVGCILTVAAIPQLTFADCAQPLTFLLMQTTTLFLLHRHMLKPRGFACLP